MPSCFHANRKQAASRRSPSRRWRSRADTGEPGGQTDEPGGQTDEPGGQTDEPGGQTGEPGGQTDEPGGQTGEPGGQTDQPGGQTDEPGLHKCSETEITDDMIFSSCCSRTTTSVQQGFDYDPVDNTLYFSQLNRWYRNIISWTTPAVTLSTDVAPKYMGLSCFSHGNNFIIERTASGEKYVWAPNFGSRGDGSYGNPWIVSRFPLRETSGVKGDILNTDPDDNYYFGVSPCWPAIDFENDLIAICAIKKTYVYRLSQLLALPRTKVTLPKAITYGGIITSTGSTSTYDSGIPEFTGKPEILARDATTIKPLLEFDTSYSQRGLHWQTFCIGGGKAYFLRMGDVPEGSVIKHDSYIEVYDLAADLAIVCNEEGKNLGLPLNCRIAGETFVGPIMLVGVDGEEFCDVPYSYDVLCAALGGQFKGGAL